MCDSWNNISNSAIPFFRITCEDKVNLKMEDRTIFCRGFPSLILKKNWRFYAFVVNWLALLLFSSKNQYVIGIASVVTCNVQHWVILTAFRELKSGTFYMTGDLSARLEISVPQWYTEFASRERKKALANVPAVLTRKIEQFSTGVPHLWLQN